MDKAGPENVPPRYFTNDRELLDAGLEHGVALDICYRSGREQHNVCYFGSQVSKPTAAHPQGIIHCVVVGGVSTIVDWSQVMGICRAR